MQKKRPKFRRRFPQKKEAEHKINDKIDVNQIRLVGDNVKNGIFYTDKALAIAKDLELDLVMISPNADPPVCKIMDYKKFVYDKKKREKEIKSKAQKVQIKEIRFTANTDVHDIEFKAKHAEKFLNEGAKVKCFVFFRGRDIIFQDRAKDLLESFAEKLSDISTIESHPKTEGRRMFMTLVPVVKKK